MCNDGLRKEVAMALALLQNDDRDWRAKLKKLSGGLQGGETLEMEFEGDNASFNATLLRMLNPVLRLEPEDDKIVCRAMRKGWGESGATIRAKVHLPDGEDRSYFREKFFALMSQNRDDLVALRLVPA